MVPLSGISVGQRIVAFAPIIMIAALLTLGGRASAVSYDAGPLSAGSGGVTGSCIVSGNACLNAGATVTCTGLNPSAFQHLYYGLRNDTINGLKEVGAGGPIAGTDQFKTCVASSAGDVCDPPSSNSISYAGTTTVRDLAATPAVKSKLILTVTAGTVSVVSTLGVPPDNANGDIVALFDVTSTNLTVNVKVQAALAPGNPVDGSCPAVFNPSRTTNGTDQDVSHVNLGFYFEDLCGNGVLDSGQGELCDPLLTTNGCCLSNCQFASAMTACPSDGNPCTTDLCSGSSTACVHNPGNNGASCSDGNSCTSNDLCSAGTCAGTPDSSLCPDAFKCYKAKQDAANGLFPKGTVVNLADSYETKLTAVKGPRMVCNATSQNGSTITDSTVHPLLYKIKDDKSVPQTKFAPIGVTVADQFGSEMVILKKPYALSVPSARSPVASSGDLDHMKCYQTKSLPGAPKISALRTLVDQDETRLVAITKRVAVCIPTSQDGGAIANPSQDLACYKIKSGTGQPKFTPAQAAMSNELATQTLELKKPFLLCVPATVTP